MDLLRMLDRAPSWVRSAALAASSGRGPFGALLDPLLHPFQKDQIPLLPPHGDSRVRLLIGPANEVEQGYQWARAAERYLPGVEAVAMMGFDPGGYEVRADLRVPEGVYLRSREWHRSFAGWLTTRTHVVIESGLALLGRASKSDAFTEVAKLHDAGVDVAVMFHGSDIRPPGRHAKESRWSPFHDPAVPTRILADRVRRNADGIRRTGVPVFVSTPDLLPYVPEATWCPVVIDPSEWSTDGVDHRGEGGRPLVVHAPSSTRIKGTERIEPIVRRLADEGLIEYQQVTGVPYREMPAVYANADIVLDQFLIGGYGVAACEGLASGALVIGHVDPRTRKAVHDSTGLDVPIVESTLSDLESILRRIVADPASTASARAAGPGFVAALHDGRRSAAAMSDFLGLTD